MNNIQPLDHTSAPIVIHNSDGTVVAAIKLEECTRVNNVIQLSGWSIGTKTIRVSKDGTPVVAEKITRVRYDVAKAYRLSGNVDLGFQISFLAEKGLEYTLDWHNMASDEQSNLKLLIEVPPSEALPSQTMRSSALSEVVDLYWYQFHFPQCKTAEQAVEHYLLSNDSSKVSLTPYFSVNFYRSRYLTETDRTMDPLEHFLHIGQKEGNDPHPLFLSGWYRDEYELTPDESAFHHYVSGGWQAGNMPHPVFRSAWYVAKNNVHGDPLYHYLTDGWRRGLTPNPLFDEDWVQCHSQLKRHFLTDTLSAYLVEKSYWNIDVHPLFKADFYNSKCLELLGCVPESSPLTHYFLTAGKVDPHPLFETKTFRSNSSVGNTPINLTYLIDYVVLPKFFVVAPHSLFSGRHYYAARPDVFEGGRNPLVHYLRSGFREHVTVHPLFDNGFYLRTNVDIAEAGIPPLTHYLEFGWKEGRLARPSVDPILSATRQRSAPVLELSTIHVSDPNGSYDQKKGVFAHIFYVDLVEELIHATNNIPPPCTLFVSTDAPAKCHHIIEVGKRLSRHPLEVRLVENRGRDIAPMIVHFADRFDEIDVGVHIHTKKSLHYARQFDAWRTYLIESNLGTTQLVMNILNALSHPDIGMVAPSDFLPVANLIQWGGNLPTMRALMDLISDGSISLDQQNILELPSGSMFWFKAAAIRPLLKLSLRSFHFEPERGQVDGTLAHAIERIFFYQCEIAGYSWLRFKASDVHPADLTSTIEHCSQRILANLSGNTAMVVAHPETRPFSPRSSHVSRPRLNLLIPTVDTGVGYAGVSEALRQFDALRAELGERFDYRVIATDTPISNQYAPTGNQRLVELYEDADSLTNVVCDGTNRSSKPLAVRANDFFVASAWWTALAVRQIRNWQQLHFHACPSKFVYLIQDYESGFYSWSTRYVLAESTYQDVADIIPVFNTDILAQFFYNEGYFERGHSYQPPINERIISRVDRSARRENWVLIYMRPHAERNCIAFAEALIQLSVESDPDFWREWRFFAIGEDFKSGQHLSTFHIEVLGRLSLEEYANLLSKARVGISLMVSPHPSYPPLEMAEAGLQVLTNQYKNKNLSLLHDNISAFKLFDAETVAIQLKAIANRALRSGTVGSPKADWFFNGRTNISDLAKSVSQDIVASLG